MDIINPQNIQDPKIVFDFNSMHGIGMVLNFKYNDNGEIKEFKRRLNKFLDIKDGNIEIKQRNYMGVITNFYQYTPDLIFLIKHNPLFFNSLKQNFENGNYNRLFGLVSVENSKIFILPEVNLDLSVKIDNEKEKNKELKVYETPKKVFDFIANILDKSVKELVIKKALSKILHSKKLDVDYYLKEQKLKEAIEEKNLQKALNVLETDLFSKKEKNEELIKFIIDLPDENVFEYLKKHERELRLFKLQDILNIKPLFMDFQAGSGVLLDSLKEKGFNNAILTGSELREIEKDDPNYKVVTGVNFNLVEGVYKDLLNNKNRKKMTESIFNYSNPPYSTDDSIGKKSIDAIKEDSLVFGLYPTKMLKYLQNRIEGNIYIIPKEATGYEDKNAPEKFLLILGKKLDNATIKKIEARLEKSKANVIEIESSDINSIKVNNKFLNGMVSRLDYSINANYDNFLKDLQTSLKETIKRYKNIESFIKTINENKDKIFNSFLPFENLKKNRIFPDTRFFDTKGNIEYLTFNEVVNNLPLLNFYNKVNPELFEIVKKIANELNYPFPDIKKDEFKYSFTNNKPLKKDLVTTDNLGMMRLYYYPDLIDISDEKNKEILKDLINEYIKENDLKLDKRDVDMFMLTIKKADKLVLKNELTSYGNSVFNNETFVFVDRFGNDLGKLNISPTEFYKLLEKKGYFNLEDYIELAKLKDETYKKLIENFLNYINSVKEKILEFNIANFKDFYDENSKKNLLNELNRDILNTFKERQKALKEGNREKVLEVMMEFADKYHFKEMFESIFEMINTDALINKAFKKYEKKLPNEMKEIKKLLKEHFIKREVVFFETERAEFFKKINEEYNLEEKIDFEEFMLDIEDALSEPYKIKKQIFTGYVKLTDILVTGVLPLENAFNVKKDFEKSKEIFEKIFLYKMGLKPHQFDEAIRYLALADDKKLEMLFWEMRSGKTRAMLAIGLLNSLKNNKPFDLIVETANMNDITLQTLESFPFLLLNAKFFVGDKNKVNVNNENVYSMLLSENIIPNLPKLLQPYLVGKGQKAEELSKTFYIEMLDIIEKLNDNNIERLEEFFKDTQFEKCLGICKK